MASDAVGDLRHLVTCPACGARTWVSPEVHASVPERGLIYPCWRCGGPLTIPPTEATLAYLSRSRVEVGMLAIAYGDAETQRWGRDVLRREAER